MGTAVSVYTHWRGESGQTVAKAYGKKTGNGMSLRFKDDLLAMIKGESETSQHTLANEGLVTQHYHCDANHDSNIICKFWKANGTQKDRRQHL